MKDAHPLWGLLLFAVLLILNNILYGMKTAIRNVNDSDFEERPDDKKKEGIINLIEKPQHFINTLQVITVIIDITVGGLLLGMFAGFLRRSNLIEGKFLASAVVVTVLFVILEVFGILVPARLALRNSPAYIYRYYTFIKVVQVIFYPITLIITKLAGLVVRLLGIDPNEDIDNVTEEEIITMVNEGHEQGVILESEAKMITNIFEFGDKVAGDVMIHRKNIIAIDGNTTLENAVKMIIDAGMSRVPIYEEDIDNIVGILHFKDAFREYGDFGKRKLTVLAFKDMLYDAHFIPETRSISILFKEMQTLKNHMSIVIDEYGQTAGLVTMEDIIEEIVGNIFDEHDAQEENITKKSENVYDVEGLTQLDDLEELLSIEFDEEEFDTLNGFLISKLGRIPEDDEKFEIEYKGYTFKPLEIDKKMITKVRIIKNDKDIQAE